MGKGNLCEKKVLTTELYIGSWTILHHAYGRLGIKGLRYAFELQWKLRNKL
jgi:hypothetical protein